MSQLHALQQEFMAYLLESAQQEQTKLERTELKRTELKRTEQQPTNEINQADDSASAAFASRIKAQGAIGVDVRMKIYANAYQLRLTEALETDHEMLGLYLGDELFARMATGYIASQPSKLTSLRGFADNLPHYLASDDFFSQYPIIADIARFERRLLSAFDAAESHRASFAALQSLSVEQWPNCQLRFHPSVQLFQCNSNAVESWQALKRQNTPDAADYHSKRAWLLWRGESRLTEFMSLTEYQLILLEGFINGATFAKQCEAMLIFFSADEAPMQVLQALKTWFHLGLIRDIKP